MAFGDWFDSFDNLGDAGGWDNGSSLVNDFMTNTGTMSGDNGFLSNFMPGEMSGMPQGDTSFGFPGLDKLGGLAQFLLSQHNASANNNMARQTAQMHDPFGSQRPLYQGYLANMMSNPNYIKSIPGYQAAYEQGLEAVRRNNAKAGRLDSGNMNYDLMNYGNTFALDQFNKQQQALGNLGGAQFNGGSSAAQGIMDAQQNGQKQTAYGLQAMLDPFKQAQANAELKTKTDAYGNSL